MSDHSRRNFLATIGVTATIGISGCLRLTTSTSENQTSPGSETRSPVVSETQTQTPEDETQTQASEDETQTQTLEDSLDPEELFETRWQHNNRINNLALEEEYLYADGYGIKKIDSSDGSLQWSKKQKNRRDGIPIEDIIATDQHIFALSSPDPDQNPPEPMRLFNTDPTSGEQRWYFEGEFAEWPPSGPLAASDTFVTFFESSQDGYKLYCFDSESGDLLWTKQDSGSNSYINQVMIRENKLFSAGDQIRTFDAETGELLQTAYETATTSIATSNSIYVGGVQLKKLSRPSLNIEWVFEPLTSVSATPVIIPAANSTGQDLIVPTESAIFCLDADTGTSKWEVRTTDRVLDVRGGIEYINGLVWAWDNAGILYIIDSESGQLYYRQVQKKEGFDTSNLITGEDTLYSSLYTDKTNTLLPHGTSALEVTNKFT